MRSAHNNRRNFPLSTLLGLGAIFIVVSALGYFSYTKLNGILEEVQGASRLDTRLLAVKDIQGDIRDAENSLKTYSITRDTADLQTFSDIAGEIRGKLDTAKTNDKRGDEGDVMLEALDSLIYAKFQVQRSILELMEEDELGETLDNLSRSLNRVARNHPSHTSAQVEEDTEGVPAEDRPEVIRDTVVKYIEKQYEQKKKRGFFGRLLYGRMEDEPDAPVVVPTPIAPKIDSAKKVVAITPDPPVKTDTITGQSPNIVSRLSKELNVLKARERLRNEAITEENLALTREEQRISAQIDSLVQGIERIEHREITERTIVAEGLAQEANQLIVVLCVTLGLLLLLLTVGIYTYFRNSSRYEKGIEEARAAAEGLAKARESFLATMSHEIRTPMNAIIGFTERVLQSKLRPEQATQLEYVRGSANHLLEIVNDVLDFSKLEAGAMSFSSAPVNLKETLNLCLNSVRPAAEARDIGLALEHDPRLPEVVYCDAKRLRQVLLNLLNNAVRFTESGEVRLSSGMIALRRTKVRIQFEVVDTGIGIEEDQQESVFEEFAQAGQDSGRNQGGTGLGLPICKRIVEAQGGKIWLKSEPGKGTTVGFVLDLETVKKEVRAPVTPVISRVDSVLVVDDTEYNRLLLQEVLVSRGLTVQLAKNGAEALRALEKAQFDLVLLDIRMPVMGGIEVLKRIRAGESAAPKDQPVIALTAAETARDREECMRAGCNAVLGKPFREEDLWRLMGMPAVAAAAEARDNGEDGNGEDVFSLDSLRTMARGNGQFVADMVHSYLEMAGRSRERIKMLLEEGRLAELSEVLHKLAPATRHLDARRAYRLIKEMEKMAREGASPGALKALGQELEDEFDRMIPALENALAEISAHSPDGAGK